MELRHLRYVVGVAEELNFSRAAERLNISQPPLSQQIRALESELGVTLFNRTKRNVQLTEAGRFFVNEARLILSQAEHAADVAGRMSRGEVGQLRIAFGAPPDVKTFIDILHIFAQRHPDVHLKVRTMSTVQQVQALHDGRIQIGFVRLPIEDGILASETVTREPLMLALPKRHRLARLSRVPLSAVANERHIMFSRDASPGFYDLIVAACRNAGLTLNVSHEVDNFYTARILVAAGLGVAFMPGAAHKGSSTGVTFRPLQPALKDADARLLVAYRREVTSDLVPLFLNVLRLVVGKRQR
jgi:DNA-binding transcriptional LysR family regulator